MMHAQVVGVTPAPPGNPTISGITGTGAERANVLAWVDDSKNETGFAIERRVAGSTGPWTKIGTVESETLGTATYLPGTGASTGGTVTFNDVVGTDTTVYEYKVYATNTVGDVWDYSSPQNAIPPGGGFPTLTLNSADKIVTAGPGVTHPEVIRVAGSNRYDTAALISQQFAPGVSTVYVATGEGFPDALAAAARAGSLGGPVLLVRPTSAPPVTATELARLNPANVVVVGGTGSVSEAVVTQLRAVVPTATFTRRAGADRYATAALVAADYPAADVVYVATGENFPDALAGAAKAGSLDAPMVLVRSGSVPAPTAAQLARLSPARIVILGGPGTISQAVADALATYGTVERVSGANRYETAALLSQDRATAPDIFLATGQDWPDALAGAARAGATDSPLLLTQQSVIPTPTWAELDRLNPSRIFVLGGPGSISTGVEDRLRTLE